MSTLCWTGYKRDKSIIATVWKTKELPRSFLDLWRHLCSFSDCTLPHPGSLLLSVIAARSPALHWWLQTLNLTLNVKAGHWVLASYPLPPSAPDWMLLTPLVLSVLKPGGSRSWANAKSFRDTVLFQASIDCRLKHWFPTCMSFALFLVQ